MKCPKCGTPLVKKSYKGMIEVDSCPNCRGMWLDFDELDRLEDVTFDRDEYKGSLVHRNSLTGYTCPQCKSKLQEFQYRLYDLRLDYCENQHGFWLDDGEDVRVMGIMATRVLLQGRVYSILSDNPSIWLQGDDLPRERYWKLLGYSSIEELGNAKTSELFSKISDLLNKFSAKKLTKRDPLYPSYFHRSSELLVALFALHQMNGDETLGHFKYSIDNLWKFRSEGFDSIVDDLYQLLPIIIENYKLLFAANFPSLIDYSQSYKNLENLVIVEVVRTSGFPALSYIVTPNMEKVSPTRIITAFRNNSLIKRLHFKSLYGEGYSLGGGDSGCGYFRLNADIDGVRFDDPEAWVIQTRYPSRKPILDQVYSLISHELKYIFNARHMNWKDDGTSQLVNDRYLRLAAKSIIYK